MTAGIAQLKKLRGKSLREISARGGQEISKLGERLLKSATAEMSDAALVAEIEPRSRKGSAEGTARLIAERIEASLEPGKGRRARTFFPSLSHRREVVSIMDRRFPSEREAMVERADRALEGRFDLLGLSDVSFGNPIDWHLEPTSGKRTTLDHWSRINYLNPDVAGDKKLTWELNRHGHFVTLGQAYWLTGDERYAEAFVAQARSWIDANPPNRGINWASSLEIAFRSIAWLWSLHLFAGSRQLEASFILRLLKHMVAAGSHIESYLSHYFSPNTHLTGEALGLFYIGTALPELNRASHWRETGLRILLEQLPVHVRPDGVYFEQSTYYHRYTADFYIHLLTLARTAQVNLPDEVEKRLTLLLDHLMWITRPDGTSPLIGDDDGGRLVTLSPRGSDDFRDTLATGAALFGRGDWKLVAGMASAETLWTLGPEGLARYDEINAGMPRRKSKAFPDGGYFVMRDGWTEDASYVIMDCGPHGSGSCGHAHADALAFEFASGGKTWLVDPGTFTYTADAEARNYFRSTEAHNAVTVDGESQSIPAGPFSWRSIARAGHRCFESGEGFHYFEGCHDGYGRLPDPVTHTRAVMLLESAPDCPARLIVRDTFDCRGHHRYTISFHLSAGCCATVTGKRVAVTDPEGRELIITNFGRAVKPAEIIEGWVSTGYGRREAAPVAIFEAEGEGPQEFVSLLVCG